MKLLKSFTLLVVLLPSFSSYSQDKTAPDCKFLKHCKLKYADASNQNDYVVINNNKHVEYLENGKYVIKSDLNWINDCEYNATLTEVTVPNFPFKPGEIMQVKYQKIENDKVYGTATVQGQTFEIKFQIIK